MSDEKGRWMRAARAGARTLNLDAWSRIVDEATEAMERYYSRRSFSFEATEPSSTDIRDRRHVILEPTSLIISAQAVLDLEAALAHATMLIAEIEQLASEDMDAARRARLMRTIEACREAIAARLRRGQA